MSAIVTKYAQRANLTTAVVRLVGLRRARLLKALTQRQLAKQAGVAFSTISRIESGEDAQPSTLRKLADALGVEPADLIEPSAPG